MAWKSPEDKSRFFEDLERAFNSPSTLNVIVPQVSDIQAATDAPPPAKRRKSSDGRPELKRQRNISSSENVRKLNTAAGLPNIRPDKSNANQLIKMHQKKSSETLSKRRSTSDRAVAEEPKKSSLLDGMVLYFIPNSKKNGLRKFRMSLFAQHGADVRHEWNQEITHIICDKNITGERVLRELRWEQFHIGVTIVNEQWVPECLGAGRIVDISKPRFQVPGVISQSSNESPESPEMNLNGSLQIKTENSKRTRQVQVASGEQGNYDWAVDAQELLFGRSSPPPPTAVVGDLDVQCDTSLVSLGTEQNPLEQAISEIKDIAAAKPFIDEETPSASDSGSDSDNEPNRTPQAAIPQWQMSFSCMHPSSGHKLQSNPNTKTIEILSMMQSYYERTNDQWRAIGYRKAISGLTKCMDHIVTEEQARAIPGIGDRLAKKIAEIATTGELQRLQNLDSSDHTLELFTEIYGVGRNKAVQWVMQGLRSLKDVLAHGKVSESQRIGIELYDDFKERIPRTEVEQHSQIVKEAAQNIDPKLQVYTMGSYRRGATTCGDIDLIITKPDATATDLMPLMQTLVSTLSTSNFLTHCLSRPHSKDGSKWHGVSQLPGGLHRRLDLLFVPWKERGAAFIYFTGNDIFNRSLRLLASKKGMGLNQRGLFKDTLRGQGRVRLTRGSCVASESEKEIFEILGVPWRAPELRNC